MTSRRFPPLRQVEDILFERGIDICHETVRFWWNRFGPMFANEIRKRRVHHRSFSQWRWHLDEVASATVASTRLNGATKERPCRLPRRISPDGRRQGFPCSLIRPVLSENHIRTYWWCSPARIGMATMAPERWMALSE